MRFHDAHCHIASKSFLKDFELAPSMRKWREKGLDYVIGVSTKYSESKKILDLSKEYEKIIPGIGVHPWSAKKPITDEKKEQFSTLFSESKRVVIGEIGLDHHFIKNEERYPYQEQYFRFFLQIAEKNNLPVNIHLKGAEEDVAGILSNYEIKSTNVLIHWYSGPAQTLKKFIERDYFFTINPSILTGSPHIEVLKEASINRILTESDGNVKYTINNERVVGSPGIIPKVMDKIVENTPYDLNELTKILHENLRNYTNIG
ncbi:MAG: TatD family hydrolase [Candidatus Heimdallarchaeaceae archaeon]